MQIDTRRDDTDPDEHSYSAWTLEGHLPSRVCRLSTDATRRPASVLTILDC